MRKTKRSVDINEEVDNEYIKAKTALLEKLVDGSLFKEYSEALHGRYVPPQRPPPPPITALEWTAHFLQIAQLALQLGDTEFSSEMKAKALDHVKKAANEKPARYGYVAPAAEFEPDDIATGA